MREGRYMVCKPFVGVLGTIGINLFYAKSQPEIGFLRNRYGGIGG